MFELNIIRRALNLGKDLHFTKNSENHHLYYPYNPFITTDSTYYKKELNSGAIEIIGKVKSEGKLYFILGGCAFVNCNRGLGCFDPYSGMGGANAVVGFLGCANKEIAKHFGKYFGMLITVAKYGDMIDFEVISGLNKLQINTK